MKITIIYDNTALREFLQPDWGFSALLETGGRRILFDTGANGSVLLYNMEKLGISPESIDDVFISHFHFDHTGGLSAFLEKNNSAKVWIPRQIEDADKIDISIEVSKSGMLYDDIYSTGELEEIEQSLCIETEKGIIVLAGCSHPSIEHILNAASKFGKVYGIIGGLHGNRPESLKNLNLICATHCTQFDREIKAMYPEQYIEGGAGQVIEI